MTSTSKKIVEAGYDQLKSRYGQWTLTVDPRHRVDYLERLMESLSAGSRVLELGCGPGIPVGIEIDQAGHTYIGVDLSREQLEIARGNVAGGKFIRADMTEIDSSQARLMRLQPSIRSSTCHAIFTPSCSLGSAAGSSREDCSSPRWGQQTILEESTLG